MLTNLKALYQLTPQRVKSLAALLNRGVSTEKNVPYRKKIRVLAYGDGLTAGTHNYGMCFEPYGRTLQARLGNGVEVETLGMCGWDTLMMREHLDAEICEDFSARKGCGLRWKLKHSGPFHIVIIWAGKNDLLHLGMRREELRINLQYLHKVCHDLGSQTVALGIPDIPRISRCYPMKKIMGLINQDLMGIAGESGGKMMYVDLVRKFPAFRSRVRFWEKNWLHMNEVGYKGVGVHVANRVRDFVFAS